jgi:hypothetical protein
LVTLALVSRVAFAGELVVDVQGMGNMGTCLVAIDGAAQGNAPLHATGVAAGPHDFTLTCAQRDPFTERREVTGAAGFQQVVFQAPPAKALSVTTPIDVYLVVRDMTKGEKVRIDGGEPVAIPYHAMLLAGPHDFVVLDRSGAEARRFHREVIGNPAGVVLKLE